LLDQDIDDPVLLLLVLEALHAGDAEALAEAEQRVVATVVAQLLERGPTVRLLGELVRRLVDRLLQRALFRKQLEHHRKGSKFRWEATTESARFRSGRVGVPYNMPMRLLVLVGLVACSAPASKPREKTTNPDQCFYGCKPGEEAGQAASTGGVYAATPPEPPAPTPGGKLTPAGERAVLLRQAADLLDKAGAALADG